MYPLLCYINDCQHILGRCLGAILYIVSLGIKHVTDIMMFYVIN